MVNESEIVPDIRQTQRLLVNPRKEEPWDGVWYEVDIEAIEIELSVYEY